MAKARKQHNRELSTKQQELFRRPATSPGAIVLKLRWSFLSFAFCTRNFPANVPPSTLSPSTDNGGKRDFDSIPGPRSPSFCLSLHALTLNPKPRIWISFLLITRRRVSCLIQSFHFELWTFPGQCLR